MRGWLCFKTIRELMFGVEENSFACEHFIVPPNTWTTHSEHKWLMFMFPAQYSVRDEYPTVAQIVWFRDVVWKEHSPSHQQQEWLAGWTDWWAYGQSYMGVFSDIGLYPRKGRTDRQTDGRMDGAHHHRCCRHRTQAKLTHNRSWKAADCRGQLRPWMDGISASYWVPIIIACNDLPSLCFACPIQFPGILSLPMPSLFPHCCSESTRLQWELPGTANNNYKKKKKFKQLTAIPECQTHVLLPSDSAIP